MEIRLAARIPPGGPLPGEPAPARPSTVYQKGGKPYFPFDGRELWLPAAPRERPARELLEWHWGVVFRG